MSSVPMSLSTRGRARAQTLFSRAGARVAELDARPATHKLLLKAIPQVMLRRFDASQATGLDCVMELRVADPAGGAPTPFAITIADGRCTITPGAPPDPGAGATVRGDDMIRLAAGAVGWPELLATKRLGMSGDVFLAIRFPLLFGLPGQAVSGNVT
jgi:hypothetical protein